MSRIKTPIFDLTIGTFDFGNDEKLSKLVNEIDVDLVSDGASSFKVVLDDREAPFSDLEKEIKEGMSVSIGLGYGATGTDKLIEGIVTGVNTVRKEYQRKTYVVTGYDGLQALTRGRKRRSWEEIKDSDIAGIIANECGLQPDTDDSEIIHPYVVQNNVTNLSFLMERAKRIGFEVKVEERRLVFKKPKRSEDCGVTLTWDGTKMNNADTSILQRCDFDTSTMGVVKKVIVRSYDPKTAEPIIGTAEAIDGGSMGGQTDAGEAAAANNPDTTIQISDQPVASQEEAEKLAQSILNQKAGEYMTGRGRCEGNGKLAVGRKVNIQDVGKGVEGDYYITSAKHSFKTGHGHGFGYWTDFTISRTGH